MGYEFTQNYDIMTKIMAARLYFCLFAGLAVNWFYSLSVHDVFEGDETIIGMRYVGSVVALVVLVAALIPVFFCREKEPWDEVPQKLPLKDIVNATVANRSFLMIMGAMTIFVVALYSTGA